VPTAPDLGTSCAACGTRIGPSLLACPACHGLLYADRLKQLARDAEQASAGGAPSAALAAWREARDLLPEGSRQRAVVDARIAGLSTAVDRGAHPARPQSAWGWLLVAAGLVAGKAKLLLTGLTKASTVLSMLLAMGVYWAAWGWKFAGGFVLSIFVHEMGHVSALRRFGIRATAPMFLPGVGAVVRFQQDMAPIEQARVGLAGPLWGFGAALAALAVAYGTGSALSAAIAHTGAWVNLFNLLPIIPLDGGRGFKALDRGQRMATLPVIAGAWYASGEGLLVLLLLVALFRAFETTSGVRDARSYAEYAGLVVGLSLVVRASASLAVVASP
jgi:Zn-dependent protease